MFNQKPTTQTSEPAPQDLFPKLESRTTKQTTTASNSTTSEPTTRTTPAPFSYATMAKKLAEDNLTPTGSVILLPAKNPKTTSSAKTQTKNLSTGKHAKAAATTNVDLPELLDDDAPDYFVDYSTSKSRAAHNRVNKRSHKDQDY